MSTNSEGQEPAALAEQLLTEIAKVGRSLRNSKRKVTSERGQLYTLLIQAYHLGQQTGRPDNLTQTALARAALLSREMVSRTVEPREPKA